MKEPRITKVAPVSAPTEPVSVAYLKSWLKLNGDSEAPILSNLITVARTMAERITRRAIIEQEFIAFWDSVPNSRSNEWWGGVREGAMGEMQADAILELPHPPLVTVEQVSTFSDADAETVFSNDNYFVDAVDQDVNGRVILRLQVVWPYVSRPGNGIKVKYTAGYDPVPADIAHAITLMASHLYANRGDCSAEDCAGACGAMGFLQRFVVMRPAKT